MRTPLLIFIFLLSGQLIFAQTKTAIDSVASRMGEKVEVCAKVHGIKAFERITYINLGAAYPKSPLTVVIFGKDYSNFKELPSVMYKDKQICVTGTVSEYKGKPQIVVTKPEEIIMQ
jgi:DNA/RNA endonuclease YhcR with UshA esterase domain